MDNLIPITPSIENIKDNQPAIKIGNDIIVAGVGGNFIPDLSVTENVQCVYKCTQITDTRLKTWNADKVQTRMLFGAGSVTGLVAKKKLPEVGHWYNQDATVQYTDLISAGPTFYATMTRENPQLYYNAKWEREGVTIGRTADVKCTQFSGSTNSKIHIPYRCFRGNISTMTYNFWAYISDDPKPEGYTLTATIKTASNNPYTFTMDDASKTGYQRTWTSDKDNFIIAWNDASHQWDLYKNSISSSTVQDTGPSTDNPWDDNMMSWSNGLGKVAFTYVSSATTNTPMTILTIGQDNNWLVISKENNRIYLKGKGGSSGYDDQFTDYFPVSDYDMSGWHMYTLYYQSDPLSRVTDVILGIDKDAKSLHIHSPFLHYITIDSKDIFLGHNKLDGNVFRGSISSLRVYNRLILADQVAQLYNETSQEQA